MTDVKIIADLLEHEQPRIAILEDGKLSELFIEYDEEVSPKVGLSFQGDIFMARVDSIVPAINAAFVALSSKHKKHNTIRNAFLYLGENEHIHSGQNIIVQVIKNARKNKAPRVSTRISVPGRWLVLVPDSEETGVSRRITDSSERKRLKKIAEALKAQVPGFGIIIRTAAENIPDEFLQADLNSLISLWHEIELKAKSTPAPCLLYRDTGTLGRVLRDEVTGRIDEIIINDPDEFQRTKNFIERFFPEKPNLALYSEATPLFAYYGIDGEIAKAMARKVWLRSGAYLVFDQTEALTVIDVNTGKFTSAPDMRHTILATNLEASEEIARQLRLRSLGGIIIVDFIDMEHEEDRNELLRHFEGCLERDRQKPRIFGITRLGLVEMTRRRERQDLKSILTRACPVCHEDGFIEREENAALNIKRFIRKLAMSANNEMIVLAVSDCEAGYISRYLEQWQEEFNVKIMIEGTADLARGKYKLKYQGRQR